MIADKTSILIVSYQTGPVLFDCLSACLTLPEKPEILIIDNGNPLSDSEKMHRWAQSNPQIKLVTGHGNVGFAAAVNKGAAQATGHFIWILNPDAIPAPNTLTLLMEAAASVAPPFLIGAAIRNTDGTEQRGGRREILTPRLALVESLNLYRLAKFHPFFARYNHHQSEPENRLVKMPVVSGASMFMHREDFIALNGFDESYFMHVEDMDLCVRVGRKGGQVYYAGHIPLTHIGGTSDKSKLFVEWHKTKGFARYFKKNFKKHHNKLLLKTVSMALYARYLLVAARIGWTALRNDKDKAAIIPVAPYLPSDITAAEQVNIAEITKPAADTVAETEKSALSH